MHETRQKLHPGPSVRTSARPWQPQASTLYSRSPRCCTRYFVVQKGLDKLTTATFRILITLAPARRLSSSLLPSPSPSFEKGEVDDSFRNPACLEHYSGTFLVVRFPICRLHARVVFATMYPSAYPIDAPHLAPHCPATASGNPVDKVSCSCTRFPIVLRCLCSFGLSLL